MHKQQNEEEFSLKSLFVPLTTLKAIHWIIIIGFLVFCNGLFGGYVWDDFLGFASTPITASLNNIPLFFVSGIENLFYRPLYFSYFTVMHAVFGHGVFPFHIIQLCIHIANSILVFVLFKKFFKQELAFLLSLLFLVHPINSESVVYISAVSDPLYVLFGLLAFHLMLKAKVSWIQFLLACVLLLFSFLMKEAGFLLLLIIVGYRFLFIQSKHIDLKNILLLVIPTIIYCVLRFFVAGIYIGKSVLNPPIADASLIERIQTIPSIIFFYISKFFVPVQLSIAHYWVVYQPTAQNFFIPLFVDLVFFIVLFYSGWYIYRKNKSRFTYFIFFVFWSFVSLGLYLQIVPLDMTAAEKYFYLSGIGLLGIIGVVLQEIALKNQLIKNWGIVAFIVILCIFSLRTMVRNTNWYTPYTLLSHDIQITDGSFDIENNYAMELFKLNRYDEALLHAKRATELNPKYPPAWSTLGRAYLYKGNRKEAIVHYKKSLELDGRDYVAYRNIILAMLLEDDNLSARMWSEKALKSFPNQPDFLLFLAVAEYNLGNKEKALSLAKQSVDINPITQSQAIYTNIQNNLPINNLLQ